MTYTTLINLGKEVITLEDTMAFEVMFRIDPTPKDARVTLRLMHGDRVREERVLRHGVQAQGIPWPVTPLKQRKRIIRFKATL